MANATGGKREGQATVGDLVKAVAHVEWVLAGVRAALDGMDASTPVMFPPPEETLRAVSPKVKGKDECAC